MGLGDFISGIFGSKNGMADRPDPYKTDPNAYEYGGHPGGAQAQAATYGNVANNYTQGAYGNFTTAQGDLNRGNQFLDQSQGARGSQAEALEMMRQRAQGNNLISQQVAAQQANQMQAQQASAAASARGPAALALAQQGAAANTAQGQAQIGAQAAIAGAQEKLANEQAYFGGGTAMRQGDLSAAGQAGALAGTAFGGGAAQGGLGAQYAGLENNVNQTQLAAQMNKQAQDSANYNAAKGIQAGAAGQNAQGNFAGSMGVLGALTGAGGAVAGGLGGKAHGGDVHGQQPYLVGEQGPELVIPRKDGYVMTAQQTAALLGAPPTPEQAQYLRARGMGGPIGAVCRARAEGGPVEAAPPGAFSPASIVMPTWGTATPAQAQEAIAAGEGQRWAEAQDAARERDVRNIMAGRRTVQGEEDQAAIDARARGTLTVADKQQQLGIAPQEHSIAEVMAAPKADRARLEDENREAVEVGATQRQARYALGGAKTADAKEQRAAAVAAKADAPKAGSIGAALGAGGKALSEAAGTTGGGYRPVATYVAPQFVALPARAFGGPIGGPMSMGGQTDPGGASAAELGMGGAGGLVSGNIGHANRDIMSAMHPVAGLFAREEGGPVKAGGVAEAAHKAAEVAVKLGTPMQLSSAPQTLAMGADLARRTLEAQGDRAGAALVASILRGRSETLPTRAPVAAVTTAPRAMEVYVAPQGPSAAPAGSGPVTAPTKGIVAPTPDPNDRVVKEDMPVGPYARAKGGPIGRVTRRCA